MKESAFPLLEKKVKATAMNGEPRLAISIAKKNCSELPLEDMTLSLWAERTNQHQNAENSKGGQHEP